jgi:hypothetical protein
MARYTLIRLSAKVTKASTAPASMLIKGMLALLACFACASHAATAAPTEGERLSDWMLRQAPNALAYPTGLLWQVPAERYAQTQLQQEVLAVLEDAAALPSHSKNALSKFVRSLPVTGRVRVAMQDARWLQAHPKFDPVLQANQILVLPQRPTTVSVLTS